MGRVKLNSRKACGISLTAEGCKTLLKISERVKTQTGPIELYTLRKHARETFHIITSLKNFFEEAFSTFDTIIAVMASGIVVRQIAPLLTHKSVDPGVIVSDPGGHYLISLLSGHLGGANENARLIARAIGGIAIITTASDNLGLKSADEIAQESQTQIADFTKAKEITAMLIENKRIGLIGQIDIDLNEAGLIQTEFNPDLFNLDQHYSNLENIMPVLEKNYDGLIIVSDRERLSEFPIPALQLIPKSLTIGMGCRKGVAKEKILEKIKTVCDAVNTSTKAIEKISTIKLKENEPGLIEAAKELEAELVIIEDEKVKAKASLFNPSGFVEEVTGLTAVSEPCGFIASNEGDPLYPVLKEDGVTAAVFRNRKESVETKRGHIFVTGIGPGNFEHITREGWDSLRKADVVVGYKTYINLVKAYPGMAEKEFLSTGMTSETDRCQIVLDLAKRGKDVTLISSGDAGIYGMAGILLELAQNTAGADGIEIDIIPGISAAGAAASVLGAPLMNDFATISLSDLLTPWDVIEKRLRGAGTGDFVIALYNPKSLKRPDNIKKAREILLEYKSPNTPVGIVRNALRGSDQRIILTDLENMCECEIDMFSTVIIGNSQTHWNKDNTKMITSRGYKL